MSRKLKAEDYSNQIMEVVALATKDGDEAMRKWRQKYGYDCLHEVTTKIIRKAMRSSAREKDPASGGSV